MSYAERRRRLLESLQGATLVLAAAPERTRSNDTLWPYRQDSDFLYLTGFPEPEAVLVLSPDAEHPFSLFVRPRDPAREIWDGHRFGPEGAVEAFGADAAYPLEELDERLPDLLRNRERVLWPVGEDTALDDRMLGTLRALRSVRRAPPQAPNVMENPRPRIHEMRVIKDTQEIDAMRAAGRLAVEGHLAAMRVTRPGLQEYQVQAEVERVFAWAGASAPAYASIVAGGKNACILHYIENRDTLRDGELLLIDAGPELNGYAGDISTTFPVGATFSPAQRDLYGAVLKAQRAAVEAVRPGASLSTIHLDTRRNLTVSLRDLGILSGAIDDLIEENAIQPFYMHGTGHFLGMDVHDVGLGYVGPQEGRPLVPGVVVTIEPGLYFPPENEAVPEAYRGIGIRIEDDILVTAEGHENLTPGLPRTVAEIEAFRRDALGGSP